MAELLTFFFPAFDGSIHAGLQLAFAAVFLVCLIATPLGVRRAARPERWERQVKGDDAATPSASYASAEELSLAAATPAERWADVLPSMLLVFGLLGTFIGLGLALTEAAGALGPGSDALASLTPIMDSLGSKFKTSTWGILAFLGLKLCFMAQPYEERRLAWATQQIGAWKLKAEARQRQHSAAERQQLVTAIAEANAVLVQEYRQAEQAAAGRHGEQAGLLKGLAAQQERIAASLDSATGHSQRQLAAAEAQLERMAALSEHSAANRAAMQGFVDAVSGNIATMASSADKMSAAADSTGQASGELREVIGEFRTQMINVLGDVKRDLNGTIDRMSGTFGENMRTMSEDLARATTGIERAIDVLSSGVTGTIETIEKTNQESVERQNRAQATFTASGQQLMESMGAMQGFVELMQQKIESGLTSVAKAGQQMLQFEKRFDLSQQQVTTLVGHIERLVGNINATSAGLETVGTLGADLQGLVRGIGEQTATQLDAARRHREQLDDSARLMNQVALLTAAVAEMSRVQREVQREVSQTRSGTLDAHTGQDAA
jgi:hypothetical protein